jgi:cell wall assembly regulator SMI1
MMPKNPTWSAIDGWLKASAPAIFEHLRAPAPAAALEQWQARLGTQAPAALIRAYQAHDGEEDGGLLGAAPFPDPHREWIRFTRWLSVEESAGQQATLRDAVGEGWPRE